MYSPIGDVVNDPTGTFLLLPQTNKLPHLRNGNAIHVSYDGSLVPKVVQKIETATISVRFFVSKVFYA